MADAKKSPATYADIEALPPHVTGEILFGVLHAQPRPASPHTAAASSLGMVLGPPFQFGNGGPGGWVLIAEPELHLGPHVVVPDFAGWRKDRLVGKTDGPWIDVPPDWACEVLSVSTRAWDKRDKMRIYATYNVPFLWHLDPVTRFLEVFRRQDQNWLLIETYAAGDVVTAPPFETLSFTLNDLWPFEAPQMES
jgi:hypothetical protein